MKILINENEDIEKLTDEQLKEFVYALNKVEGYYGLFTTQVIIRDNCIDLLKSRGYTYG